MNVQKAVNGIMCDILCVKCHKPIDEKDYREVHIFGKRIDGKFGRAVIRDYHTACADQDHNL